MRIKINGKVYDTAKDKRTLNEVLAEVKKRQEIILDFQSSKVED